MYRCRLLIVQRKLKLLDKLIVLRIGGKQYMREYKIEEYIIRQTHAGLYQHIVYEVYKDEKLIKSCWSFNELAEFIGIDAHTLDIRMKEIDERE